MLYDISAKSESSHSDEEVREISFPAMRESFMHKRSNSLSAAAVLCQFLRQQVAFEVDMEKFDGNLLNFMYFRSILKEAVENKLEDARGKLTRLTQYTGGEAKDLVKNCI